MAWETYEPASGTLSFEAGEGQRALVIKLIPTDRWSPVLDFAVELLEEGLENAKLGQYGVKTRIKVIDKDAFPCPEMQVITQMGGDSQESPQQVLHDFSLTRLVIEFCRLNFNCNAKVRVGTIKTIMLDAFRNLIKLLHLYLRVYWLDKILKTTSEPEDELFLIQDRAQSLYVYMVALIVPFAILHIFEYLSLSWGVNGATTTWVQSALLRRYLNYSTAAQSVTQPAHIQVAMNFDAKTLAIDGYGNVLRLFNELENLAVLIVFQITAPYVFGKPFRPSAFTVVLVLPVVLFAFLYCRSGTTKKALAAESTSEANAVSEVEQTVTNFHLISDYSKRGAAVDQFERVVQIFRAASKEVGQMLFNNRYFCKWMSELLIAGWRRASADSRSSPASCRWACSCVTFRSFRLWRRSQTGSSTSSSSSRRRSDLPWSEWWSC
ncbi:unnamed protein product [Effrenium voratum]|nr:unnamed protein product [Effrenium voratum]